MLRRQPFKVLASVSLCVCLYGLGSTVHSASNETLSTNGLLNLSLEELVGIEISSVSKKPERLVDAPGAIFVITADDLQRSGVRSIPDALRMVPGVQVAQVDSNKWAVTARSFNGRFANKLLVLIDGRTVYSPVYSSVYWESKDTFIEDIERIEVVRGPGATLWGANAVNGVINIITRHAADTQGTRAYTGLGNHEKAFAGIRHGFRPESGTDARVYIKFDERGEFTLADDEDAGDDWGNLQGGFRIDRALDAGELLTLQGDLFRQHINQYITRPSLVAPYTDIVHDNAEVTGINLLGRWARNLPEDGHLQIQAYIDHSERDEYLTIQRHTTLDFDLLHRLNPAHNHALIWGLGYRFIQVRVEDPTTFQFANPSRDLSLYSAFIQDEISLVPERWKLILGSKLEHNDLTGFEIQPSARLLFKPEPQQTLWAAVSRAVRTPSIGEQSAIAPITTIAPGVAPNPGPIPVQLVVDGLAFNASETVLSYEFGWRFEVNPDISLDLAAYSNHYSHVSVFGGAGENSVLLTPVPHVQQELHISNGGSTEVRGIELAADWRADEALYFRLAASHQRATDNSELAPDFHPNEDKTPRNQLSLRSEINLSSKLNANLWLRYVDHILGSGTTTSLEIPAYTEADLQLSWQPQKGVELSLVGRNLLHSSHLEFVAQTFTLPTEVERSVYAYLKIDF